MSDNEKLVWAAAFGAAIGEDMDGARAVRVASWAVAYLREGDDTEMDAQSRELLWKMREG